VILPTHTEAPKSAPRSTYRLLALYAIASLVPVAVLGAILIAILNGQVHHSTQAHGHARAVLITQNVIAPQLSGQDLSTGLTPADRTALGQSVAGLLKDNQAVRVQVLDLSGQVVYDSGAPSVDPSGVREITQALNSTQTGAQLGVVRLELPAGAVAQPLAGLQHTLLISVIIGLIALWLSRLFVSASVTRRLRRQLEANAFLATHDPLTGLPNRAQFAERAIAATTAATVERRTAVALIDLDRFKEVNDTLGHGNGDKLLILVAERLKHHIRESDTVARLGGDEFGIILRGLHGPSETFELLTRLRSMLAEPLDINGLPLSVECSIGFTLAPDDGGDLELLLQRADVAMYAAKRAHAGVMHYQPEHDTYDASALALVGELGSAIENDELLLHYQPKGDLGSGTVQSVEALVRWQHPNRGLLYPDAFLPAAEQTELIESLTHWVIREASSALDSLDPKGLVSVAVNVSARSMTRPDFADAVINIVRQANADPRRIIIELTETALLVDPARAVKTLNQLNSAGMRIAIDDFGAGQTSLGYLASLPISELKIDRAFVAAMLTDQRNAAIVRSVIELGHSIGATVTAEGVETPEALEQLREFHCDTVQGFLIGKPLAPVDLASGLLQATVTLGAPAVAIRSRPLPVPAGLPEPDDGGKPPIRLELWRNQP
jgi:diguanylate cyclase (GGDEF)-like protein